MKNTHVPLARPTILITLMLSALAACSDGAEETKKPVNRPTEEMGVDRPDQKPDTDAGMDSPDADMGQVAPPDAGTDLDVAPCQDDASCGQGNHCDAGVCKPGACAESSRNACGGCAPLTAERGAPCGSCLKDTLGCSPDQESLECSGDTPCSAPSVETDEVTNITQFTATLEGRVLDVGDSPVSQHGFCLSEVETPTLGQPDSRCSELGPLAQAQGFNEALTALPLATSYRVRAYAVNAQGPSYGQERTFRTEDALLPQVTTDTIQTPEDGVVQIGANLLEVGIPALTGRGVCLGEQADPALGDGASSCDEQPQAAPGAYTVRFEGLTLGKTYHARAFARSSEGQSYGQSLTITLRPSAPQIKDISEGADVAKVELSWDPVAGATGYKVLRDGLVLTAQPITAQSLEDTGAAPGGAPVKPATPRATTDQLPHVRVTWSATSAPGGQRHQYTVIAVNAGGDSDPSPAREGWRAPQRVTGYQLSIGGGNWTNVTGTAYNDTSAPAGSISQANASASQGTSSAYVELNLSGADASPGASVNYKVRAVNAAGPGQESDAAQGHRAAPTVTLQWQRSSGPSDGNYTDLSGATGRDHQDRSAPADGTARFYRAVITGGPAPVTTAGVSGYRDVSMPELLTLAATGMTVSSATLRGRVTTMGATPIIEHGYCYGVTSQSLNYVPGANNPSCRTLGARNNAGDMTAATVIGLQGGTRYSFRAFAVVTKNASPAVAYGNVMELVTVPAAPVLTSASSDNSDHVRLFWSKTGVVDSYEVYRGSQLIATIPVGVNTIALTHDDTGAAAPKTPNAPQNLSAQKFCNGVTLSWSAPTAAGPGDLQSYTLRAKNASGTSATSNAQSGRRAAAPILGYKIARSHNATVTLASASATSNSVFDMPLPSVTPGTITASQGTSAHPTYVQLTSSGATKGVPANATLTVRAYNASGDGATAQVVTSRSAACPLHIQWQRSTALVGPYQDIVGARGASYQDTGAPPSGQRQYYRARVFVQGSDDGAQNTPSVSGWRYSIPPAISTVAQGSLTRTRTTLDAHMVVTAPGVPAVTTGDHGLCISTSLNPAPGQPGSTCLSRSSVSCAFVSAVANPYAVTSRCTFLGLSPNTNYIVRAWAINARTSPGYVFGDNQIYKTNP